MAIEQSTKEITKKTDNTKTELTKRWFVFYRKSIDAYSKNPLEFFVSLSLVGLGLWLVIHPNLVAYGVLRHIMDLPVWGPLFILIGMLSRIGLLTRRRCIRQIGLLSILFCRLFLLTVAGLSTGWISPVIPEHAAWSLFILVAYIGIGNGKAVS